MRLPALAPLALGAAVLVAGAARTARAQPACEDDVAVGPNRVYVQLADTQVPIFKTLGKALRAQSSPITIVYSPAGSCQNIAALYNGTFTSNATAGGTFYIPADSSFDPKTSPVPTCTPPAARAPDLAVSIVVPDATNCPTAPARPASIVVERGPVQAMVFVVPGGVGSGAGSTQTTITAEEAYLLMGFGATNAMVPPWGDPGFIFGRPASKGTQISIGAALGVPAAKWQLLADPQHQIDQSSMLATAVASHLTDGNAEKTLGILGSEIYDQTTNRAQLHALAFRWFGQQRSYWPDSTPTSFDKRNVRDGHYALWSYVQYVYQNNPSAGVRRIIDLLLGEAVVTSPVIEPLGMVVNAGLVPLCAMQVQRTVEGGPLSPYAPAHACRCFYEKSVPGGTTTCATCDASTPCSSGTCNHGYCEVP